MSEYFELLVGEQRFQLGAGSNLLDALNQHGLQVPYSCRAGSCQVCQVRCLRGDVADAQPEALNPERYAQGWRLACQCHVLSDLELELYNPQRDGLPAQVLSCEWLAGQVLRLRLMPERPLRYQPGQHLLLWTDAGVARPYSLASVPGLETFLELHIDCRDPGAFRDFARRLQAGESVRLGQLSHGALHYDPQWNERPLYFFASGTGLAPLWSVLREALRQSHQGPIELLHIAQKDDEHYLQQDLNALAQEHARQLRLTLISASELPAYLAQLKLVSRQSLALVCGSPLRVEHIAKRLFLLGLPRSQVFSDVFLPPAPR